MEEVRGSSPLGPTNQNTMKKITKAIIPAAGFGTRFLPQTKAMPKEMLPIIDKPIIQYVVEEAVSAGITDIIIVTGIHKRSIEDHFDHNQELESRLIQSGKNEIAEQLGEIAEMANFIYVRQKGSYGNATPIINASHLVADEAFLVLWADDFFVSKVPRSVQLMEEYEKYGRPVISLVETSKKDIGKYGSVKIKKQLSDDLYEIDGLVEKPKPGQEPSLLASVGGYILTPEILPLLANQTPDHTGEVSLAQALNVMAEKDHILGKVIEGRWHDTGNKEKYLEAIVDVALEDPELSKSFREYLRNKL